MTRKIAMTTVRTVLNLLSNGLSYSKIDGLVPQHFSSQTTPAPSKTDELVEKLSEVQSSSFFTIGADAAWERSCISGTA